MINNNKHSDKKRGVEEDRINNSEEEESDITDAARTRLLVRNRLRRDPRAQKQALPKTPAWSWIRTVLDDSLVAQMLPRRPAWSLENTGCWRGAGPAWAATRPPGSLSSKLPKLQAAQTSLS